MAGRIRYERGDGDLYTRFRFGSPVLFGPEFASADQDRVAIYLSCANSGVGEQCIGSLGSLDSAFRAENVGRVGNFVDVANFNIDDDGPIVTSPVFSSGTIGGGGVLRTIECLCDYTSERPAGCDDMRKFDFRSEQITTVVVAGLTLAIPANGTRINLAISVDDPSGTGAFGIEISFSQATVGIWLVENMPMVHTFPYRDYGPLMREPVWFRTGQAGASLIVTETWLIPQQV